MIRYCLVQLLWMTIFPMSLAQLKVDPANDYVKIGNLSSTPQRLLHLSGTNALLRIDRQGDSASGFMISSQATSGAMQKNFFFGVKGLGSGMGRFTLVDYGTAVGGAGDRRLVIDTDGTVIIGTANEYTGTEKFVVEGDAYKTVGGDTWNFPASSSLVENVNEFSSGLSEVLQLNPVHFEYNGLAHTPKGSKQIGVIAQELQQIAPHMVSKFTITPGTQEYIDAPSQVRSSPPDPETYLSVNASSVKWMLVNAIKEQQKMIEELQEIVEKQGEEIEELKKRNIPKNK